MVCLRFTLNIDGSDISFRLDYGRLCGSGTFQKFPNVICLGLSLGTHHPRISTHLACKMTINLCIQGGSYCSLSNYHVEPSGTRATQSSTLRRFRFMNVDATQNRLGLRISPCRTMAVAIPGNSLLQRYRKKLQL